MAEGNQTAAEFAKIGNSYLLGLLYELVSERVTVVAPITEHSSFLWAPWFKMDNQTASPREAERLKPSLN